mmetsp:Transcript_3687/g.12877  ORF Transcript_3687/g.12877 Transcript_3687/m.12877 type:complete len:173 (+) Transcript_3687:109-627(+)
MPARRGALRDVCRFCGEGEGGSRGALHDACGCYKKLEGLRTHRGCLEEHLNKPAGDDCERGAGAAPPRALCEVCRRPFRVRLSVAFTTERLWSAASCQSYFEGAVLLLTSCMMVYSVSLASGAMKSDRERREFSSIVLPSCALLAVLTAATVRAVYQRWRARQLKTSVVAVV